MRANVSKRLFRTLLVAAAAVVVFGIFRSPEFRNFSLTDFGEYWAAGRLLLAHQNPYSPAALRALQSSVGFNPKDVIMMWNPPWALTIVLPFASLPYQVASLCWMAANAIVLLAAAGWLWRIFFGTSRS